MTRTDRRFPWRRCPADSMTAALATFAAILALVVGGAASAAANSIPKTVQCSLPYTTGGPNFTCTGTHQILYSLEGFTNNNAKVTADLEARDADGNVLRTIPVHSGDFARISSNKDLNYLTLTQDNNFFTLTAPVPVLHVTADDGETKAEAFCSPFPFVQVLEPNNTVSALSEGDITRFKALISLVDPSQLVILVDGVDVFAALGIGNPASCTVATPCAGGPIPGESFSVSDIVVDVAPAGQYGANLVTMSVTGLGCGGHLFSISGKKLPKSFPNFVLPRCNVDDLADTGLSSGFGVTVTKPDDFETGVTFPVRVKGKVCSGRPIATLNVNGKVGSTAAQVFIPGDGVTTADSYTLKFKEDLSETDLALDVSTGNAPLGTYDRGTNRIVAAAKDDLGNRAFSAPVIFATGAVQNPGILSASPAAAVQAGSSLENAIRDQAQDAVKRRFTQTAREAALQTLAGTTTDIQNAFVIGLSAAAIQQQFTQRCKDPVNGIAVKFAQAAVNAILATPDKNQSTGVPCITCGFDLDFTIDVTGASVPNAVDNIVCTTTPDNGVIHVTMNLPNVIVDTHTGGECGAIPVDGYKIDLDIRTTISGITLSFDITEGQIQNQIPPDPNANTTFLSGNASSVKTGGSGLSAYGICDAFSFLVQVFTFGLVDLTPSIDIHTSQDFTKQIGNSKPDPVGVCDINVEQDTVSNFNGTLEGKLSSVSITPAGLRAGLKGSFGALDVNPDRITPGAVVAQPALPTLPVPGASDAFVVLSTDALNQLFASLALGDKLKTSCQDTGLTLGNLLPADCNTMTNDAGLSATAAQQGICHAVKGADCETLKAPLGSPDDQKKILKAIKQGACHGFKGDNCSSIPVPADKPLVALAEKATCNATPSLNMNAEQAIIACTGQSIPPRLLPTGGGGNLPVSATLRLRSLSASLILDREGTGAGNLADPKCFAGDTNRTVNCSLFEACLDINYLFDMSFQTCTDGKPGILPKKKDCPPDNPLCYVQTLVRQAGVICDGSGLAGSDLDVLGQSSTTDAVRTQLPNKAEEAAPPLCTKGLDLSGLVNCTNPKLVAIETGGDPNFKDWLGVTCTAGPPVSNQPPRDCQPSALIQLGSGGK